jgi:hypothetical protein
MNTAYRLTDALRLSSFLLKGLNLRSLPAAANGPGKEDVFRSGLNAPSFRRCRPPLHVGPTHGQSPISQPLPLVYFSSAPEVWFYPALVIRHHLNFP